MFAIVMQTGTMSAMGQWLVIGLTLACVAAIVALSGEPTKTTRLLGRIGVGLLVAVVLATVAAGTAHAVTIIECQGYLPSSLWWLFWSC